MVSGPWGNEPPEDRAQPTAAEQIIWPFIIGISVLTIIVDSLGLLAFVPAAAIHYAVLFGIRKAYGRTPKS